MKKLQDLLQGGKSRQALRGGAYSLAVTAVVLAIVVVVNILASALPASLTRYDISSSKLYSITSNTKAVVSALTEDVTIYWIVQSGEEDEIIENLLEKYDSLSDHIEVVKRNPDVYPTFAAQYTDETVANNSLVVECGDKSRYIALTDIYLGEVNVYSGTYDTTDFDGEGAITSAIDYVTSDEYPQVYLLEGPRRAGAARGLHRADREGEHGDAEPLPSQCGRHPGGGGLRGDLRSSERPLGGGGGDPHGLCCWGREAAGVRRGRGGGVLENLYSLLSHYGVTVHDGLVVDTDRSHYALGYPYLLMPDMSSSPATDALMEENYYPILPLSLGLTVSESTGTGAVTSLLTTSQTAISKAAGYEFSTYDYEEGDAQGPFTLAVSVEDSGGGQIYWFASDQFLQELYNAFSSGANLNMAMNALGDLIGESEAMAIRSKSLNYNYLTISDSTASLLKTVMVGVFPLAYLAVGIIVVVKRKKVQNETSEAA